MSEIELKPVKSTNIAKIGHDEKTEELQIEFKDGAVYAYDGVPAFAHRELIEAKSIGGHFHKLIKSKYKFRKVK